MSVILRFVGVGPAGRLRFMMVAGIGIGLAAIILGAVRGRPTEVAIGVIVLVSSALFWPWLLRTGRRRGTI